MRLSAFLANSSLFDRVTSNNQKLIDAMQELRGLVIGSVDNPEVLSLDALKALVQDFRTILRDGVVTPEELASLSAQVDQLLRDAGVTVEERRKIVAQVQEVADLTDREPKLDGEFATQLQAALVDGIVSDSEKAALRQTAAAEINERLGEINQEFFQELQTLRILAAESIVRPIEVPTPDEIEQKLEELRDTFADGITPAEGVGLFRNALQSIADLGIDATEARNILLQSQTVAVASDLVPATSDNLTGTNGNDFLIGNNGDDILTGASTNNGRGEIDILFGGAGADTFVLGNETTIFYDDGIDRTQGLLDYALILDFDPNKGDVIQLKGKAADYTLGSIPQALLITYPNLDGTAISTLRGELIGVVFGVSLTGFNNGFTFA